MRGKTNSGKQQPVIIRRIVMKRVKNPFGKWPETDLNQLPGALCSVVVDNIFDLSATGS